MGTKIGLFEIVSKMQKLWQNRRRVNGVRVDYFQGFNMLQLNEEVKSLLFRFGENPENSTGRIFLFLSMFYDISCATKDNQKNVWQRPKSYLCMLENLERTMSIYWSWFSEKVVLYQWRQSTRNPGQNCRKRGIFLKADVQFSVQQLHRKGVSSKAKDTENCRYILLPLRKQVRLSHNRFFKSAQSLRSSRWNVWRTWIPSRQNGETRCVGTIMFVTRAQCDQDRSSFGLWGPSESRSSIVTIWRTNWEVVTAR